MPLTSMIVVDKFDVWEDFVGPFLNLFLNDNILVYIDYVSKWAKAILTRTNETKVVIRFLLENILPIMECCVLL